MFSMSSIINNNKNNNNNKDYIRNINEYKGTQIIKTLFIYWNQGFENAPVLVKKCLLSWKLQNPTWNIIELDETNINEYIKLDDVIPNINNKKMRLNHRANIIRLCLLEKYGGCWCDATTFCNKPLDSWLNNYIQESGFFAFERPLQKYKSLMISNWFLYSSKNHYIIKQLKEKTIEYWSNRNETNFYFWFHAIFDYLYNHNKTCRLLWNSTGKINTDIPHFIEHNKMLNPLTKTVKEHIDNIVAPMYKLSWKFKIEDYNEKSNVAYLLNKI